MRILFLTQWFDPEPAYKGVAFVEALAAEGFDVEVATAFPNYPGGKLYAGYRIWPYQRDRSWSFPVHRLAVWPSHDRSSLGRMLNYASFFVSSLLFGLIYGRRYDAVYVYHPPIMPALAAALFTGLWRRPFLVEIQDLWPDSVMASGMGNSALRSVLDRACAFVYRRAAVVIAQSNGMKERLRDRGVAPEKVHRLYNWSTYLPAADLQTPSDLIAHWDENAFNFVYGGNLGQAQDLACVIDALVAARQAGTNVNLHLFGQGIERAKLIEKAARSDTRCVFIHPPVTRSAMDRIFDRADALVLHLKQDPLYDVTIPSKLQHYLSVGKPIVAGLGGEAAELLINSKAALVCQPGDVAGLADAIAQLAEKSELQRGDMSRNAKAFYARNMAMDQAIRQTADWIKVATRGIGSNA